MDKHSNDPHEHDPPSDDSQSEPTEDLWGETPPPHAQEPGSYPHNPYSGANNVGASSHNTSWDYRHDTNSHYAQPPPHGPTNPPEARDFQMGDALGTAWRTFAQKPLPWLGLSLAFCVIVCATVICGLMSVAMVSDPAYADSNPAESRQFSLMFLALFLGGVLLSMTLNALLHHAAAAEMRGKPAFDKFFSTSGLHLAGSVLMQTGLGIMLFLGLLLAVIPGLFIATFSALACAHYALDPAQGVRRTLRKSLKTLARSPVAILGITVVLSLVNFFSLALPPVLIPLFPLEIMVVVYLAMLSNHERPAHTTPPPQAS